MKKPLLLIVLGALATGCARGPSHQPASVDTRVNAAPRVAQLPPGTAAFSFSDERQRQAPEATPGTRLRIDRIRKPKHLFITP